MYAHTSIYIYIYVLVRMPNHEVMNLSKLNLISTMLKFSSLFLININ